GDDTDCCQLIGDAERSPDASPSHRSSIRSGSESLEKVSKMRHQIGYNRFASPRSPRKNYGLRTRGRAPAFISLSDCLMLDSNSSVNSRLSSTKSSSQSRICLSSALE